MGDFMLTFAIRSIKIFERNDPVIVKIDIGSDEINLKQTGDEFKREITLSLKLTPDQLDEFAESAPGTLSVWYNEEELGKVSTSHLLEIFQKAKSDDFKHESTSINTDILNGDETVGHINFIVSLSRKRTSDSSEMVSLVSEQRQRKDSESVRSNKAVIGSVTSERIKSEVASLISEQQQEGSNLALSESSIGDESKAEVGSEVVKLLTENLESLSSNIQTVSSIKAEDGSEIVKVLTEKLESLSSNIQTVSSIKAEVGSEIESLHSESQRTKTGSYESYDSYKKMKSGSENESFGSEKLVSDINLQKEEEEEEMEKIRTNYYIVNGTLLNLEDIRGPCGNAQCPVALLAKQELRRVSEAEKCFCNEKCYPETAESFLKKMAAVDPYKAFETPPDNLYVRSFLQKPPPAEGKCTDIFSKERERAGAASNQCLVCTKTLKPRRRCTLCRRQSQPRRSSPLNTSMSEEFSDRRPHKSLRRRPGSLCCTHKCKKCNTCTKLQKSSRSKSTSDLSSMRYSMYGNRRSNSAERKSCATRKSCVTRKSEVKRRKNSEMTCQEQMKYLVEKLKQKPRKFNIKPCYYYRFGNRKYLKKKKCGHRECVIDHQRVPPHMGWRWNIPILGINDPRTGWKPGAVRTSIKDLMKHFLSSYPCDTIPNTKLVKCVEKGTEKYTEVGECQPPPLSKPTLQVQSGDGEYVVAMNPLKDSKSIKPGEDPYINCPPIKFRIIADAEAQKKATIRKKLVDFGFKPCICKDPNNCNCRPEAEKTRMKKELQSLSHKFGVKELMKATDFTIDNTDKKDTFEFTPPSALVGGKPKPKPKKDTITSETQYNEKDFVLPTDHLLKKKDSTAVKKPVKGGKGGGDSKAGSKSGTKGAGKGNRKK